MRNYGINSIELHLLILFIFSESSAILVRMNLIDSLYLIAVMAGLIGGIIIFLLICAASAIIDWNRTREFRKNIRHVGPRVKAFGPLFIITEE